MEIINFKKAGGSYFMQSWPEHLAVPDGWAVVSDELDRSVFYDHNGFVVLTTTTETVEDATITVVTAWEPDLGAWEGWKASLPDPVEPEPSAQDDLDAMMVDHEYRLTLLELGLTE